MNATTLEQVKATFKEAYTRASIHTEAFGDIDEDTHPLDISAFTANVPAVELNYSDDGLTKEDCETLLSKAIEDTISVCSAGMWLFAASRDSADVVTLWHLHIAIIGDGIKCMNSFGVEVDLEDPDFPQLETYHFVVFGR